MKIYCLVDNLGNILNACVYDKDAGWDVNNIDKFVYEETILSNDASYMQLQELGEKNVYIKKWYKVENGQLAKRSIPDIQNVIELTTTAQDTVQPFDGIPDVPADGVTPAVINVAIKNPDNNQIDITANDVLYVSTDRGKLSMVNVQLVSGQGSFEIRCSETIVATIKVWHPQNKYREASIKIQFRPV